MCMNCETGGVTTGAISIFECYFEVSGMGTIVSQQGHSAFTMPALDHDVFTDFSLVVYMLLLVSGNSTYSLPHIPTVTSKCVARERVNGPSKVLR